jgi:plastocyanin
LKRLLRLLLVPVILITLTVGGVSCGGDDDDNNPVNPGPGGGADLTITISGGTNATYSPSPANMNVGQTVRWVNNDNMTHTATHTTEFNVTVPANSSSSPITMTNVGTFNYICTQSGHTMSGQLVVGP